MTDVAHAAPDPADLDLQLAQDPRAGAGRLMVLAGNRPDLRGVIVDNPGCSPELRAWVSRMGGASTGSEAAAARADGADDADGSVSLAPTGWEPSDIGLGDDPFGSVLGDPLMGSPLFDDDGGPGHESADAEPAGAAGRNGEGGRRLSPSRSTAKPRTASSTAAARTSQAPAPPPQRPSVTMPPAPAPMPPGRFAPAAPSPVPGAAGPGGGAPSGEADNPRAVGGAPAGGGLPPVPPGVAGAPGASFGVGDDNTSTSLRTARRPAPSSQSSTSPAKVVGWILFVLLFIVIRACNG